MDTQWRSSENYINNQFLEERRTTQLTKTVEVSYRVASIGDNDTENSDVKINGFSFFCDDFLIYAETEQDELILGLNNHTYLEFKRVVENGEESKNLFRLIGVRSVDSRPASSSVVARCVISAEGRLFISAITDSFLRFWKF